MSEIELAQQQPSELATQMRYAQAVATGSMLPDQYRNNPANVLIAVGLGQSMGLSPAESLYRINVIKGKPTAAAELIASNVRKAGHKLRVTIEPGKATASIWRADDPDFEHSVTRDAAWAQRMGLSNNDNYKKQGDTMLSWRAITAVARLACPEALYGVSYTPDEMHDLGNAPAPQAMRAEQVEQEAATAEHLATRAQVTKIAAAMGEVGITDRDGALLFVNDVIKPAEVASRNDLTREQASAVIDALDAEIRAGAEATEAEQ